MVTLAIYIWCILFFIDGTKEFLDREKVPQINTMERYNEFEPDEPVTFEEWEFIFAFGLAGGHNFAKNEPIEQYGDITLSYRVREGDDGDEKIENIPIEKCQNSDKFHTYAPNQQKLDKIARMFKNGIFYCPKNYEDIEFYGNFYAESYSML